MTNFISTGSIYWLSDEEIQILEKNATNGDKNSAFKLYQYHMFFTQGNKEKAIFWAKKAYRNGAKLPDELKILININ